MGVATERWSDRKKRRTITGNWVYGRGWDVIDYADDDDAIASVGVNPGDSHPDCASLTCTSIDIAERKPGKIIVRAVYEISSLKDNGVDPVSRPPMIAWANGKNSEPIDTDINGNAILNAAGDAPADSVTRNFSVKYLRLRRFEPYYNQAESDLYTDTTNSQDVVFNGIDYGPGQMYLHSYVPTGAYQEGCNFVEVEYYFEIRSPNWPNLTDLQIRYPFQLRLKNVGSRCKYTNPQTSKAEWGQLYYSSGEEAHDVLLDETGVPIDPSVKVTQGGLAAVAQTLPSDVYPDIITGSDGKTKAVFLVYMRYAELDFNNLGG